MIAKIRMPLPNSAFADSKGRAYPIIDESYVISAMATIMWQLAYIRPEDDQRISYLQGIHDRVLKRAKELQMDFKHHKCKLCDVIVKVEFT